MRKLLDYLATRFTPPPLTTTRAVLVVIIAVAADALQFFLGPLGWVFVDSLIDVVAMILTILLLGFHLLLLPTFVMEFIPGVDMLPTWTACVLAVMALRKREPSTTPPKLDDKPVDQKRLP